MGKGKKVSYGKEGDWEVLTLSESVFDNPFDNPFDEDGLINFGGEDSFSKNGFTLSSGDEELEYELKGRYSKLKKVAPLILGVVLVVILKEANKGGRR